MQTSRLLARLIGPLVIAMGIGLLFNTEFYRVMAMQFLQNYSLIYVAGLLTLLAGVVLVNFHNVWAADWRVIITVFGWLSVFGGLVRVIVPQAVQSIGEAIFPQSTAMMLAGAVMIGVGGWLCFEGYLRTSSTTNKARKRGGRK